MPPSEDIKSIEISKDASSTRLSYVLESANEFNCKLQKGDLKGKAQFSFSSSYSSQKRNKYARPYLMQIKFTGLTTRALSSFVPELTGTTVRLAR